MEHGALHADVIVCGGQIEAVVWGSDVSAGWAGWADLEDRISAQGSHDGWVGRVHEWV
jgi:hypothetical protein